MTLNIKTIDINQLRTLPENIRRKEPGATRRNSVGRNDESSAMTEDLALKLQREQYRHDRSYHAEIIFLHKNDRLKHYGLHFAKYVGRLARGRDEIFTRNRTLVDALLISLCAANCLNQRLEGIQLSVSVDNDERFLVRFAEACGRFADACEKIDHHEEFLTIALKANQDLWKMLTASLVLEGACITKEVDARRKELRDRQFFNVD